MSLCCNVMSSIKKVTEKYQFTDLANVSVVQSSVDLIQDKEGGGFVAGDEQERRGVVNKILYQYIRRHQLCNANKSHTS